MSANPIVDLNLNASNIPLTLGGSITASLDSPANGGLRIKELPKINVGIDPIEIKPLHLALDTPIRLGLEPIRCHVPINMAIGFTLFGKSIACIRFFGETQFIAEPYVPNPCECGGAKKDK